MRSNVLRVFNRIEDKEGLLPYLRGLDEKELNGVCLVVLGYGYCHVRKDKHNHLILFQRKVKDNKQVCRDIGYLTVHNVDLVYGRYGLDVTVLPDSALKCGNELVYLDKVGNVTILEEVKGDKVKGLTYSGNQRYSEFELSIEDFLMDLVGASNDKVLYDEFRSLPVVE